MGLRIAINATSANIGGGVTYLTNLIPQLLEHDRDNNYYLIVTQKNRHLFSAISGRNLRVLPIKAGNVLFRVLAEQLWMPFLLIYNRIDILYCPANIAPIIKVCKTVLQIQSIDPFYSFAGEPIFMKFRNLILKCGSALSMMRSDAVICLSDFTLALIRPLLGVHRDLKIVKRVYLGIVNNDRTRQPVGRIGKGEIILSVSNLTRRKNFEDLIRAYSLLGDQYRNKYGLVFVGQVSNRNARRYYQYLLDLIRRLGLIDRVRFTGGLSHEKVVEYLHRAIVYIQPSKVENFSFTPLEAMAAQVPVIVSDQTGNPESVGIAGRLYKIGDANDLALQIKELIDDPKVRSDMITAGNKWVAGFTWAKTAQEMIRLFHQVGGELANADQAKR